MSSNLAVSAINGVDISVSPVATQAFATGQDLGVNQTWQDVTGSRVAGTTYTNSTGRPIQIFLGAYTGVSKITAFIVDGKSVPIGFGSTGYYDMSTCNVIVPNGITYSLALPAPNPITAWLELR